MIRLLTLLWLVLGAFDLFAVRHVGFETDLFNRAFPLNYKTNVVFSPLSAEIDCALTTEAMDTLSRASVAEKMGVLVEFTGVYRPILESFAKRGDQMRMISARGFCVPDIRLSHVDCLQLLQREYGAEVMPIFPVQGAESWFRTSMDGTMEDFVIPVAAAVSEHYSFYDLLTVDFAWKDPFPLENSRKLNFSCADGTVCQRMFMSDVRIVDIWDAREYSMLRLPLKGDCDFYALLPKKDSDMELTRQDFSSMEIDTLLSVIGQTDLKGVYHGPAAVVLPRFDIVSRIDFTSVLMDFRVPISSLLHLAGDHPPREYVQRIKFRLVEHGPTEKALERKATKDQVGITADTKKLVFNRPFVFFAYDRETQTIPVSGLFMGSD